MNPDLARPPTFGDLDAAVATGVLQRPDAHVLGPDHDDRLVEDLVLHEVTGLGDLLEATGHLPHP